jgi:hypothetical protein
VSGQLHGRPLYRQVKSPVTHWIGGWMGPEPVWAIWRSENSWPYQDSKYDHSVVHSLANLHTDLSIPTLSVELSHEINADAVIWLNIPCTVLEPTDCLRALYEFHKLFTIEINRRIDTVKIKRSGNIHGLFTLLSWHFFLWTQINHKNTSA